MYGEFSMSMRTKNPAGSARSRILRRLSIALALSTSRPSCVSLSEMLRPMPRRDHRVDHREVVARRRVGAVEVQHALAEQIERDVQAARFDGARRLDRFGDGLAGDEAAREAGRLAHAVARRELLEGLALREEVEKCFGRAIEHQWVRPVVTRRCSIVRA